MGRDGEFDEITRGVLAREEVVAYLNGSHGESGAKAEARVHGTSVDQVHFHEVGAVDAIVDVTGACIGLHLLGVDAVHCSALPVGGGFVTGAHGRIPIPGPGTAELLKGFPVVDTGVKRELVTPTGAAILTTLAASAGE